MVFTSKKEYDLFHDHVSSYSLSQLISLLDDIRRFSIDDCVKSFDFYAFEDIVYELYRHIDRFDEN